MNVNLTPELERLVQDKVASGLYASQSEVVREALRLMVDHDTRRQEQLVHLRDALEEGLAQAAQGRLLDGPALVAELRAHYRDDESAASPKRQPGPKKKTAKRR